MSKVCATCNRENPADAWHCYACRSRAFGDSDPYKKHRIEQRQMVSAKRTEERKRDLDEAIDSCKAFPGTNYTLQIAVVAACTAILGFMTSSWSWSWIFKGIGVLGFAWLGLIVKPKGVRILFERRRRKLP